MNYYDCLRFLENCKNAKKIKIGSSVFGRALFAYYFDFGSTNSILIQAGIHAREHITLDIASIIARVAGNRYEKYYGKMPNLIIIPCSNPDGNLLCTKGINSAPKSYHKKLIEINGKDDFSLFKANANGVDLNNNFDAYFNKDFRYKNAPSSNGFPGKFPESEPESQALARAIRVFRPIFTISLHCKGEEIYYDFHLKGDRLTAHKKVALFFSNMLKYKLVDGKTNSCGGFKDYCVLKLKIPSITIEVGSDNLVHPLKTDALFDILPRFKTIFKVLQKTERIIVKNKGRF